MIPPAHRATTAHLGAAHPFLASTAPPAPGVVVGRDLLGGVFHHDPFELYAHGGVSNPNMVVIGQIGRGKSAFVKTFLWRQSAFGRQAWVVDPKGEYGPLARAWGVEPVRLRPGGGVRLNPLDLSQGGGELLASLVRSSLGRPLLPREHTAVDLAMADAAGRAPLTVPGVVEAMLSPEPASARAIRTDRATLLADGREVALALRRLVRGDLAGMFDGETSPGVDLDAPLVVLDLSALQGSSALGLVIACALAWLGARLGGGEGPRRFLVVDEAWAVMADQGVARWLQASWKLARARGVANVAVAHRVSDLAGTGDPGAEGAGPVQGLVADSETAVVYAQPPGEAARAARLLGLSTAEEELLPRLGRGVALWKVGRRSFLVAHGLSGPEKHLVDTDARMAGGRAG